MTSTGSSNVYSYRIIAAPVTVTKMIPMKKTTSLQMHSARPEAVDKKYRQGQILLVSLLENFCSLVADTSKAQTQKLFYILCSKLSEMGVIDNADLMHELSAVRESYKRAFMGLVADAIKTVKDTETGKTLPAKIDLSLSLTKYSANLVNNDVSFVVSKVL